MSLPRVFHTIGIYGVGLLGGSIGLCIKENHSDIQVIGIGRSSERLETASRLGAIDSYTTDPSRLEPCLDLLIVCTPVSVLPDHVRDALPAMKEGAVITDVGSTKTTVVQRCEALVGNRYRFVGSHPMAGSHKTGVEAATADLMKGKTCVVTDTILSDEDAVSLIADFWVSLGMRVVRMNPEVHDRLVARSSHLPHLAAVALCHSVKKSGMDVLPVLGDGFKDTTRIAAGDPGMWTDICVENPDEIVAALEELRLIFEELSQTIRQADRQKLHDFFNQAQEWKNQQIR